MYRRCGFRYEKKLRGTGVARIAGIDEAGREALAGDNGGDVDRLENAGASVNRKVTRGRMEGDLFPQFPQECLLQHKGYGTGLHLLKPHEIRPCPIHRRSFEPVAQPLLALEEV